MRIAALNIKQSLIKSMEFYAKPLVGRKINICSKVKYPRFILKSNGSNFMEIPEEFLTIVREKIPVNVRIQFPNGRVVHVHCNRVAKRLIDLYPLNLELGKESGLFLIMSYHGDGIFSVAIIGNGRTEIEYPVNRRIARSPVLWQDLVGGKRWKFLAYAARTLYLDGSIPIGDGFVERFKPIIPETVTICLPNGDEYQCKYSPENNRIHGLQNITDDFIVEAFDILIFTYQGMGIFALTIFTRSGVEKLLGKEFIEIESDTSEESEVDQEADHDPQNGEHQNNEVELLGDAPLSFERILSCSNADNSSHGVHIPRSVIPAGRDWESGETIILQTDKGSWNVGIVMNNLVPRFSRGWNQFCKGNTLTQDLQITFTMVQDAERVIFRMD